MVLEMSIGTSLVVQWLKLHAPSAGGLGSIPGQGTRSHMLQLRVLMPQLKDHTFLQQRFKTCVWQLRPATAEQIII